MSLFPKLSKRQVLDLPLGAIRPNPGQPRKEFHPDELAELAQSIQQVGVLQPLSVRRTPTGWELVAGERRLRAARLAGLAAVPCLPVEADGDTSALLALVENLQRQDLHYFEEAAAIANYLRSSGDTQEEAAAQLGRSPSAVANKLRLLRLSPACQALLLETGLTERHARALLRLETAEQRVQGARRLLEQNLTVAQTEEMVDAMLSGAPAPPRKRPLFIAKDVRLFLNTITRSLDLMRSAGVNAQCDRQDSEESITLTIHIPRRAG